MKILVRGTNWIGDAVMTVPALRALRRLFSDAEIVLHTRTGAASVFDEAEFVDRVVSFSRSGSMIATVLKQSRVLRRDKFDLAIVFPNSLESALTVRIAGIPTRIGYASDGRGFLLTDAVRVPVWKSERHEVYYYLELIAAVEEKYLGRRAVSNEVPDSTLAISDARRSSACDLLKAHGATLERPVIALGVGSTNSRAKRWPAASYALLADKLSEQLNANIILIGSEGDRPVADEVRSLSTTAIIDLTGKTDVSNASALLGIADLLISNDMGLAHIAPAIGTPTLVIFGPTDPNTTRPFSDRAVVIRKDVECSPCMLRDCPIDHRCMVNVSVEDVLTNALQILHLYER